MKKTSLILAFAFVLVVAAGAAYAADGEQEVNNILKLIQPVLDMVVGFIGAILDEFVRAIKDLFGMGGGTAA